MQKPLIPEAQMFINKHGRVVEVSPNLLVKSPHFVEIHGLTPIDDDQGRELMRKQEVGGEFSVSQDDLDEARISYILNETKGKKLKLPPKVETPTELPENPLPKRKKKKKRVAEDEFIPAKSVRDKSVKRSGSAAICNYVKDDGSRCKAPALKGETRCRHHIDIEE